MKLIGKLTDKQYDLLISCFKCRVPRKVIAEAAGISILRVCHEWERWVLCCAISELQPPKKKPRWNDLHLSNNSKVFSS